MKEVKCTVEYLSEAEMKHRALNYDIVDYVTNDYRTIASYAFFVEVAEKRYLVYMNPYSGNYPVYDVLRLYPARGPKILGRELYWDEAHAVVERDNNK